MVLDETILSLSAGGGGMRMSRGGRGGNRRRMMRRVMSLCRGGSGCSGSKYGTGGRGSLGREWRDHRCGYRGGLLTRQHRRCNTYTPVPINCFSIAKRKKKNKRKREKKKKIRTSYRRSVMKIESTLAAAVRAIHSDSRSAIVIIRREPRPFLSPPFFALLAHSAVLPVYRATPLPKYSVRASERANE